ncbi:protein tamozhennic [Anopheles aquasalis]|uniref:protein tamozhennic n=1 Tax=Anopheles aquasalis TaxID=42839 RepID=UPI00215B1EE9|nr:protein tamozhennic [Anopheles aquasalis]
MAYATNESHDALWKQILEHHWKYVESEESMQKIELRRELEDLIEKRLGKVPPNEKFYLDDTRYVFDSSVAHLDDFSAYKASIGFEAISQYANNLFVKPWRKEYKVIKMYSGFYQHEIAANLVNAEKLFQAMGYQLMPNKTLILDGPICPDQVMNVARDAITAYVECQIMKRIYCELTSLRLSVDWIDIYNFRSYHAADAMQMVKQMAAFIQEKHHKKQQAKLRDAYGSSSAALPPASSCNSCNPYQFHVAAGQQQPSAQAQPPPPPPPVSFCGGVASGASANGVAVGNSSQLYSSATVVATPSCSIHSQHLQQQQQQQQPQQAPPANAFGGGAYQPHHPHHLPHHHHHHHLHHSSYGSYGAPAPALGTMPHSKSLDHYQDANSAAAAAAAAAAMYGMNGVYMQRHSIDQPYHYTGSAMAAPPYAAAANVAATPFDGPIDGMLPCGGGGGGGGGASSSGAPVSCSNNHPYNVPGTARYPPLPYGNYPPALGPPMAGYMNGGPAKLQNGATLADGCYRHPPMNGYIGATAGYPSQAYRGSSSGMGFLPNSHCGPSSIYDPASVVGGPAYPPQPSSILSTRKKLYDDYDVPTSSRRLSESKASASGAKKLDRYHKNSELLIDYESDMLPETLVERNQLHQQQQQQQQQPHHHHHYLHHQTSRNSRQSDFDSYEDEQQESNVSRRISSKNQDGIGCYETWNYVYQNLEKQGYSKDLGERGDFLVDEDEEQQQQQQQRRADMEELDRRERRKMESGSSATLRRSHNEKLKAMKPKSADKVDGIVRNAAESTNAGSRQRSSTAGAGGGTGGTLVQKMAKASLQSPRTTDGAGDGDLPGGEPRTKKQSAIGGSSNTGMNANKENNNHPTTTSTTVTTGGGILVNHHNHSNGTVAGGVGTLGSSSAGSTGCKKKTATFDTGAATIINPTTTAASSSGGNAPSGEWNCNFCTFLNPDVKRICDMCSKSRDFRLDGAATTSNGTAAAAAAAVAATCV